MVQETHIEPEAFFEHLSAVVAWVFCLPWRSLARRWKFGKLVNLIVL